MTTLLHFPLSTAYKELSSLQERHYRGEYRLIQVTRCRANLETVDDLGTLLTSSLGPESTVLNNF